VLTINKTNLKYYFIPVAYISSLLAMEFYPNIVFVGLFLLVLLGSVVALLLLMINRRQRTIQPRFALTVLALIPIIDLSFGLSNKLRDELKGQIVLSIIDDSFATSKVLTVRQNGTELNAIYETSIAGFADIETAHIEVKGDTIAFRLVERQYTDLLVLDRDQNILRGRNSNSTFRILVNQIIE
jgi:hypothetical protein